jgi:outer membrane PBP1 activator LpoA protein
MKAAARTLRFFRLLLPMVALIAGCETVRLAPLPAPATPESAEKAERAGEYVLAAREYLRLAETAVPPQKQNFELYAVDALIKAGQVREARDRIQTVNVSRLDTSFRARRQILEARLLSLEGSHEKAIRLLNAAARARNLNPALLAEIHRVRAHEELALDNPIGAVRNLINREPYIVGKEQVAENQMQLWKIIAVLPRALLQSERSLASETVLSGWIELALLSAENAGNSSRLASAIARWRTQYPKHPAGESLLAAIVSPKPDLIGRIERIALLLPLSSGHALAAQAVRDGFLAMDTANGNPDKPAVKVYDTGSDPAKTAEIYSLAVSEGAQVIVGPLGREAADNILQRGAVSVPTLLLSHVDDSTAVRHLFQFGLPPEQEARQAAERAYLDGHRQAAVLYPRNAWGERMLGAFTAHWQRLGGIVVTSQSYTDDQSDHSEPIKQLLNIEQSMQRKELLEAKLRVRLPFEARHARPRQDIDFIFLAADAKRGRLIKPQLNFFQVARVPVYATSHIFAGKSDPVRDADLDGVLFPDMPWMLVGDGKIRDLRQQLQRGWPHARSDLDRLYALGVDSYAILPHLNSIGADPGARFSGVTSGLSLDRSGRLQRQLLWARFKKGVPRLVDTSLNYKGQFEIDTVPGG